MDSYPTAISNQLPPKSVPGQWTTGLYDCSDDPSSCFLTIFCPCITFGRIAEILDEGATTCSSAAFTYYCFSSCSWISAIAYRTKLRSMYSLEEEPCSDCYVHCCCNNCGLMQLYRELNNRGIDPAIGWKGNVEKGNPVKSKVPPSVPSGMAR